MELKTRFLCVIITVLCVFGPTPIRGENHYATRQRGLLVAKEPRLWDEYGNIRLNDERARLDNFAIAMQNEPNSKAYLIGYGGTTAAVKCHGLARAYRAKQWLVNGRYIETRRIIMIDGGFRSEPATELWLVRKGEAAPRPSETVARKKVRFSGSSLCGRAMRLWLNSTLEAEMNP